MIGNAREELEEEGEVEVIFKLYYEPAATLRELPCNAGIDEAVARAEEFQRQGMSLEIVDTAELP